MLIARSLEFRNWRARPTCLPASLRCCQKQRAPRVGISGADSPSHDSMYTAFALRASAVVAPPPAAYFFLSIQTNSTIYSSNTCITSPLYTPNNSLIVVFSCNLVYSTLLLFQGKRVAASYILIVQWGP